MFFQYTEEDLNEVLSTCFISKDPLKLALFPRKEKRKYLCLLIIKKHLTPNQIFTEKEINAILKPIYEDYVMIRRYLIDYGILNRKNDGSEYWMTEENDA
jgi:hypothetical protein